MRHDVMCIQRTARAVRRSFINRSLWFLARDRAFASIRDVVDVRRSDQFQALPYGLLLPY